MVVKQPSLKQLVSNRVIVGVSRRAMSRGRDRDCPALRLSGQVTQHQDPVVQLMARHQH